MYASTGFPHNVHWNAHQLAEAMPRRLSALFRFDVRTAATTPHHAGAMSRRSRVSGGYLPAPAPPPPFRLD